MAEVKQTVEIVNAKGLHARASAKFVNMCATLPSGLDVRVAKDGNEAASTSSSRGRRQTARCHACRGW